MVWGFCQTLRSRVIDLEKKFAGLIVFAVTFVLNGCATVSPVQEQDSGQSTILAPESEVAKSPTVGAAIQPDLLYVLLSSEIAGQRGQLELALDGYVRAAEVTGDLQVIKRAVRIAQFAKSWDKGSKVLDGWLALDSSSVEANRLKAEFLLAGGKVDDAQLQYERLLALPAVDFRDEVLGIIRRGGERLNSKEALKFASWLITRYEGRAEAHYGYGLMAFHAGELKLSLEQVEWAKLIEPDWIAPMILESRILAKQGNLSGALVAINQAMAIAPENPKLKLVYAQLLLAQNKAVEAEQAFREVLEVQQDNADALFSLALLELRRGESEKARKKFLHLIGHPKWAAQSVFYLGRIAGRAGRFSEAISWFERVRSGSLYFDSQLGVAQMLVRLERLDEALQRIDSLRKQKPAQSKRLLLLEGDLLREARQDERALKLYGQAITQFPDDPEFRYARSLVAERLGLLDLLESDLLHVLSLKPDDASALNALGYTLANRTERFQEAEVYLKKALALKPNDAAILDSVGWLRFRQGKFEQALEFLRKAYKSEQDPEIASHLGEVLWALGQKDEAAKIWREADRMHPGNEFVIELKSRFKEAFSK